MRPPRHSIWRHLSDVQSQWMALTERDNKASCGRMEIDWFRIEPTGDRVTVCFESFQIVSIQPHAFDITNQTNSGNGITLHLLFVFAGRWFFYLLFQCNERYLLIVYEWTFVICVWNVRFQSLVSYGQLSNDNYFRLGKMMTSFSRSDLKTWLCALF